MINSACIISNATLRTEDLIPAFMDALAALGTDAARKHQEIREQYTELFAFLDTMEDLPYSEREIPRELLDDASWLLNEDLFNLLNEFAPKGTYFSSHEGDGACFGFWEIEDEDEDEDEEDS